MQQNNPFWLAIKKYVVKDLRRYTRGEEVSIVIPDDSILNDLYATFDVNSFEEMFPNGEQDLNMALPQMIFLGNKIPFSKNGKEIDGIRILNKEQVKTPFRMTVYYIEGFLQDDKLAAHLENVIFHSKSVKANFSQLPNDILQNMVEVGQLTGKDLTALCVVNKNMEIFCQKDNYRIFRLRLAKEFGVNYYDSWYQNLYNPREMYLKYHTSFFRVFEIDDHFAVQFFQNGVPMGSSGGTVVSETLNDPGSFDVLEEIDTGMFNPVNNSLYLIFDRKNPSQSASLFIAYESGEIFRLDPPRSGDFIDDNLSKYLKISKDKLAIKFRIEKRTYENDLANNGGPRLGGKFEFNGVQLDYIDIIITPNDYY